MRFLLFLILCISTSLFAQEERSTIKSTSKVKHPFSGETYAILIGVSKYKNYPSLNYAANDALLMRKFLQAKANVKEENIKILVDENANSGEFHVVFTDWLKQKQPKAGDRIFIFLAGHGESDGWDQYFLAYNADQRKIASSVGNLSITRLKRTLAEYQAKNVQVILILDACRTTEDNFKDSALVQMAKTASEVQNVLTIPGMITFYASQDGAPAYESNFLKHGFFTHYFVLGAIREADKEIIEDSKITIQELFNYVSKKVQQESRNKKFPLIQEPQYCCKEKNSQELFWVDTSKSSDETLAEFRRLNEDNETSQDVFVSRSVLTKSPPAAIAIYNKFQKALSKYNLVYGPQSALSYYYELKSSNPASELVEQSRLLLISNLINYAKLSTIKYILGIDEKLIQEKAKQKSIEALEYEEMAKITSGADFVQPLHCLETAMKLTANKDLKEYIYPRLLFLKARAYFNGYPEVTLLDAIGLSEEALKIDSGAAHVYHLLAMLENERGNYKKADEYVSKALIRVTDYNTAAAEIGREFMKLSKYHEASLFYRIGTLTADQFGIAYNNLAILHIQAGNTAEAEKWFKKAAEKAPSSINLTNLTIYYFAEAKKAKKESHFKRSEQLYISALKVGISKEVVLTSLGTLYEQKEQHASARNCYLKALHVNKKYVAAAYDLMVLYFNNHFYDSAVIYSKHVMLYAKKDSAIFKNAELIRSNCEKEKKYFHPASTTLFDKLDPEFKPESI